MPKPAIPNTTLHGDQESQLAFQVIHRWHVISSPHDFALALMLCVKEPTMPKTVMLAAFEGWNDACQGL